MLRKKFSRALGRALAVLAVAFIVTSTFTPGAWAANQYKTLYRFRGGADGSETRAVLIFDTEGNLYGTTIRGGDLNGCGGYGCGVLFKLAPNGGGSWTESVLHSFKDDQKDGTNPLGGLIFGSAGNLYGTTEDGGEFGSGTIFELTNTNGNWVESVLYSFGAGRGDGAYPSASLILDKAGNLFGTTESGDSGAGTVFELKSNANGTWTESVIHSFNGEDGSDPVGGVIFDLAGNLYGTTSEGGTYNYGTAFQLTPNGNGTWTESVLHSFNNNGDDGYYLDAGLIIDATGSLYGVTARGGVDNGGTIFKLTPKGNGMWAEKLLHSFNGTEGANPYGGLIFDSAGDLYGETYYGAYGYGTIFELKADRKGHWKAMVLHSFRNRPGASPYSGMTFDGQGNLYGTTEGDATKTWGSVFEITP
jgi:uncharacterized repeat protein (TIGR03803 family)